MKGAHRSALLGCLLLAAGASGAERTAEGEIGIYRAIASRIAESAPELRGVCAVQLSLGVERGVWSAEAKAAADSVLRVLFDGTWEDGPIVPARWEPPRSSVQYSASGRWSLLRQQLQRERDPAPATAMVFDWLEQRVRALEAMRLQAGSEAARWSLPVIERGWLAAQSAADLRATVLLMQRAEGDSRMVHSEQWRLAVTDPEWRRNNPMSESFRHRPRDRDTALLIEFWSLLGSNEPLLLPAPEADFHTFAKFCLSAEMLKEHASGVLALPSIAARLADLRARFRREVLAIQQSLDDAILQDLPAEDFARRWERLDLFALAPWPMDFALPVMRPGSPSRFGGFSSTQIDYRDILREQSEKFARRDRENGQQSDRERQRFWQSAVRLPEVRGDYRAWLEWRQAETSGSARELEGAAARLRRALSSFEPPVADHLRRRLDRTSTDMASRIPSAEWKLPAADSAKTDPVAVLTAALKSLAVHEQSAEIGRLATLWRALGQPGARLDPSSLAMFGRVWPQVWSKPGRLGLAEVRERAVRALLEADQGASPPVENLLQDRMDAALQRRDWPEAARLVAVACAADLWPQAQCQVWAAEIDALQTFFVGDSRPDRMLLLNVIRNAAGRPAGEVAARRFKELR